MRISLDSLLSGNMLAPATTAKSRPKQPSPTAKAEAHRIAALTALRHWGHLRCSDIARLVWPNARFAEQMSQRLMRHLDVDLGEVLARANSVGATSYVLTRRGAAELDAAGLPTKHGLELSSVAGSTFRHRCLAASFGIAKILEGHEAYGEHAIAQGIAPTTRDFLSERFGKLPDLLIVINRRSVIWVEVESSSKQLEKLQACIRIAGEVGRPITQGSPLLLSGLVFAFDASQGHAQRIARAARCEWRGESNSKRDALAGHVTLAEIDVEQPLRWRGVCERPLKL
jgi:hypothetical protein